MKNAIASLLLLFCIRAIAQQGILKESFSLKSNILGKETRYSIYLPADYEKSNRRYPVLYLLHGFTDDETGWTQFGDSYLIADKMIQNNEIPPMIIVMPDGGISWYINNYDGKVNYEDFFIKEFIPYIDANYRTRTNREFRAISGLSMGGFGAFDLAVRHPDLFSATAPMSAGIHTDEELINLQDEDWNRAFGSVYGPNLKGKARLTENYLKYSPYKLVENTKVEELSRLRYYIDCGDKDFLIKGNMALHAALIDKKVPHEFRVRAGVHNWTYWRTALPEVLKFVSEGFHR